MSLSPRIFDDSTALGSALARRIVGEIASAGRAGRPYLLGCPGGRSLLSTYPMLRRHAARQAADLSPLRIVMMDDYVLWHDGGFSHVPLDAHYSCRRFALEEIAKPLSDLPGAPDRHRIWMPDPADPSHYDRLIAETGGIDLFLLASGATDGHIAFNPFGSPRDSITRIVELSPETRRDNMATFPGFQSLAEVPTHGVTVGIGTIADLSRSAVMVCLGHSKQEAARRISTAARYDPSWPATIITEIPHAELWIDPSAEWREQPRAGAVEVGPISKKQP